MSKSLVRAYRAFAPSLIALAFLSVTTPAMAHNDDAPVIAELGDEAANAPLIKTERLILTGDNSRPDWKPVTTDIPAPRDITMPGEMRVSVDTDRYKQGILSVRQVMPITPASMAKNGEMVMFFPNWLPGNHAPRGEMDKVADLVITVNGAIVPWRRDPLEVHAIRFTPPKGAKEAVVEFDFLSATSDNQGRVVATPEMLNLRWMQLSFYPAGYYARGIAVEASFNLPDGWEAGTALSQGAMDCAQAPCPNFIQLERTDYDTLVDSPIFAGQYSKSFKLSDSVDLFVMADEAKYLEATDAQIEPHRALVREAKALFGSEPFDQYVFLLALSDRLGGIGLEHHRSSENGVEPDYFTAWDEGPGRRNLLPHEYVHSWVGKHRRPVGLFSANFNVPQNGELLWVYEGQTQFWGYVLGNRSGLFSLQDTLDSLAIIAAGMEQRTGRRWRPLVDTTADPVIKARRPAGWNTMQRNEDYYNEGLLIWLEADQIIRKETGGKKSLDDFALAFFGGRDGDWGVRTFTYKDVVDTLNTVHPYDWDNFLQSRVYQTTTSAPLDGITLGDYKLVYTPNKSRAIASNEKRAKARTYTYSLGLSVNEKGEIKEVVWDSPAFVSGLTIGHKILTVNGANFSYDNLEAAITLAATDKNPILFTAEKDKVKTNYSIDYSGGLVYPALEKIGDGPSGLEQLLEPKVRP